MQRETRIFRNAWAPLAVAFLAVSAAMLLATAGCASFQTPPMEAMADRIVTDVVKPALEKAFRETASNTFALQGGAQAINPQYVLEFEGKWVVGVEGRITLGVEGFAGQVQGATQGAAPGPAPAGGDTGPAPAVRLYPAAGVGAAPQ